MADLLQDRVSIEFGNRRNEVVRTTTTYTHKCLKEYESDYAMSDTHTVCKQHRIATGCAQRDRTSNAAAKLPNFCGR